MEGRKCVTEGANTEEKEIYEERCLAINRDRDR